MAGPSKYDFGAYHKPLAVGATTAVAAGAGDATAITGASHDTRGYGTATFCLVYKTTLTAAKNLSFAVEYQESSDDSSWDTAVALQAATVAETGAQSAKVGKVEFDLPLRGKKRYLRFNFTPDLSHTSTDTVDCAAVCVLGGADALPAT